MTFTIRQAITWSVLCFVSVAILTLLICGGFIALLGLSLGLNLFLSWQWIGNDTMLRALGLNNLPRK